MLPRLLEDDVCDVAVLALGGDNFRNDVMVGEMGLHLGPRVSHPAADPRPGQPFGLPVP